MRFPLLPLSALILIGCAAIGIADPDLKVGEHYRSARAQLIAAGWRPLPAKCSPSNMCFQEFPEMATDMKTGAVCPVFAKDSSKLTVCLKIILDGAKIESFRVER